MEKVYLSEKKTKARLEKITKRFCKDVEADQLSSDDYDALKRWCKVQDNAYLMIFDSDDHMIFETDGTMAAVYEPEESDALSTDYNTFLVDFKDGAYRASMIEFSEYSYYDRITLGAIWAGMVCMTVCTLIFSQSLVRKITFLSKEVSEVQGGNLEKTISVKAKDEIGKLGQDIDDMRLAIINHYEEAQKAWEANKELLTSISHDIRTPLTTLIGYSEMMTEESCDPDSFRKYAEICREKAYQLKNMTDQMFRYFLVYGNTQMETKLEKYEAEPFFEQFVGEYVAMLSMQEYNVIYHKEEINGELWTDVGLLRRVFDNVFSNIEKYGDKQKEIGIHIISSGSGIRISIENTIAPHIDVKESTRIGLKTCKRVMKELGGSFETREKKEGGSRIYESLIVMQRLSQSCEN